MPSSFKQDNPGCDCCESCNCFTEWDNITTLFTSVTGTQYAEGGSDVRSVLLGTGTCARTALPENCASTALRLNGPGGGGLCNSFGMFRVGNISPTTCAGGLLGTPFPSVQSSVSASVFCSGTTPQWALTASISYRVALFDGTGFGCPTTFPDPVVDLGFTLIATNIWERVVGSVRNIIQRSVSSGSTFWQISAGRQHGFYTSVAGLPTGLQTITMDYDPLGAALGSATYLEYELI